MGDDLLERIHGHLIQRGDDHVVTLLGHPREQILPRGPQSPNAVGSPQVLVEMTSQPTSMYRLLAMPPP